MKAGSKVRYDTGKRLLRECERQRGYIFESSISRAMGQWWHQLKNPFEKMGSEQKYSNHEHQYFLLNRRKIVMLKALGEEGNSQ